MGVIAKTATITSAWLKYEYMNSPVSCVTVTHNDTTSQEREQPMTTMRFTQPIVQVLPAE
jgi:hypothetical protein